VRIYASADGLASSGDVRLASLRLPRIAGHHRVRRRTRVEWRADGPFIFVCVSAYGLRRECRAALKRPRTSPGP
jgi:hypothetical protein